MAKVNMKILITAAFVFVMLFSACQKTPEELVVRNKADGKLDELIQQTAQPKESTASEEPTEDKPAYTTESYDYSFKSKDQDVTINVKADVALLEGAKYQVADIAHSDFSMEFVERACGILLEGKEMFEPRKGQTKAEIEAEILKLQAALANPEQSKSDGLSSGDPETVAKVTEMFEDRIKIYKQLMEKAPETIEKIPATFRYMPKKYYANQARYQEDLADYSDETDDEQAMQILDEYENEMQFIADADLSNDYYGRAEVGNYTSKWQNSGYFYFIKSKELNTNTFGPSRRGKEYSGKKDEIQISKEEAIRYADSIICDMGIENMALSDVYAYSSEPGYIDEQSKEYVEIPESERIVYRYTVRYVRQYGPLAVMDGNIYYQDAQPEYGPRYGYEELKISIDNDGIMEFYWQNKPQTIEVENDNVAILPLDEIMEIFNKQMALQYNVIGLFNYDSDEPDYEKLLNSITDARIDVNSVKLKMVRIPIENQMGQYRMIPAWIFKGTKFFCREGSPNYEDVSEIMDSECFLIINAIDGSIIQ